MQEWSIKYWSDDTGRRPVERWLDSLDVAKLKSVSKELKLLKLYGNQLHLPHSRPLEQGLFELRERRYSLRIYYGFRAGRIIVLLVGGDKSTQESDIKVARRRLKQLTTKKDKEE